jgi:F-type H+-transporting ATPase subunit delta
LISGSIARRYAKALLAIGVDSETFEKLGDELKQFADLMGNKELRETLENPSHPLSKRKAIIKQLVARLKPSKTTQSFVLLLTDRNRLGALPSIAREYEKMVDDHAGRVRADVTSAQKLSMTDVTRLKQALEQKTGKNVILQQDTDPELIAGMVTQIGSIVYDGSIRTRLEQMRQSLIEGEHA